VDCVVPVSADNPLAYNLALVSLYRACAAPHMSTASSGVRS